MQQSRYDYLLAEATTVPLTEHISAATGKKVIEVLYHPGAPFSIRELCDEILPALGRECRDTVAYFQTPVRMRLAFVPHEQGDIALLTFHSPFQKVTPAHMKHLKKVIGSLAKMIPCEVVFTQTSG